MTSSNVPLTAIKLESTSGQESLESTSSATEVNSKVTPSSKTPTTAIPYISSSTPAPVTVTSLPKPRTQQPSASVVTSTQQPLQQDHQFQQNPNTKKVLNPAASTIRRPEIVVVSHPGSIIANNNVANLHLDPQLSSKQGKKKKSVVTMAVAQTATPAANQGENTGRWTAEEHRLFLQGLEQHGKGWKKIASLIKSRTVVQIRTHAQKYFQKLAKARQNGEEGDIIMENRERISTSNSSKRRRSGTKRKAIQSVVASAEREGKRRIADSTNYEEIAPLPIVAPALVPFVTSSQSTSSVSSTAVKGNIPFGAPGHEMISAALLEDSLFRFLTPAPNETERPVNSPPQVNDIARQAGANPITVPSSSFAHEKNNVHFTSQVGGDVSPTGVADFPNNWAWSAVEPPIWYTKGADVDDLLNDAEALNWLADSGGYDDESYTPSPEECQDNHDLLQAPLSNYEVNTSTTSEPSLISLSVDVKDNLMIQPTPVAPLVNHKAPSVPTLENHANIDPSSSTLNILPLPSFFESSHDIPSIGKSSTKPSLKNLFSSATEAADAQSNNDLLLFGDHLIEQGDEQAFVTALLDKDSTITLSSHQ